MGACPREGETHLSGADVPTIIFVHIRVVFEKDVQRCVCSLGDRETRVARDDNVRDLAVLAREAKAQFLPRNTWDE